MHLPSGMHPGMLDSRRPNMPAGPGTMGIFYGNSEPTSGSSSCLSSCRTNRSGLTQGISQSITQSITRADGSMDAQTLAINEQMNSLVASQAAALRNKQRYKGLQTQNTREMSNWVDGPAAVPHAAERLPPPQKLSGIFSRRKERAASKQPQPSAGVGGVGGVGVGASETLPTPCGSARGGWRGFLGASAASPQQPPQRVGGALQASVGGGAPPPGGASSGTALGSGKVLSARGKPGRRGRFAPSSASGERIHARV